MIINGEKKMPMLSLRPVFRAALKAVFMFPAGVFAYAMFLRSQINYRDYAETVVGGMNPDAVVRATDPGLLPISSDVPLWNMAQQGFWVDIFTVATGAQNLLLIGVLCLVLCLVAEIGVMPSNGLRGTGKALSEAGGQ